MAITVTRIAATPNMLRFKVDSSAGGGETATITQETMTNGGAHSAVPGPLKDLLTSPLFQPSPGQGPNPNTWVSLHTDARLTTTVVGYGLTPVQQSFQYATPNVNELAVALSDIGSCIVELQYENTLVR